MRKLYTKQGSKFPEPIKNLWWPYAHASEPMSAEVAKEYNGRALEDLRGPTDCTKLVRKAGEQVSGFAQLRDDGMTMSGCWIFAGSWTQTSSQFSMCDCTTNRGT